VARRLRPRRSRPDHVQASSRNPGCLCSRLDNVTLPPELERFATEAVAAGPIGDAAEWSWPGVSLLQRAEAARAEFTPRSRRRSRERATRLPHG
jgi:hypothetical protein